MALMAFNQGRSTLIWGDSWIRLPAGAVSRPLSLTMGTAHPWNLLSVVRLTGNDPVPSSVL